MRRVAYELIDNMSASTVLSISYRSKMAQITAAKPPDRKLLTGEFIKIPQFKILVIYRMLLHAFWLLPNDLLKMEVGTA